MRIMNMTGLAIAWKSPLRSADLRLSAVLRGQKSPPTEVVEDSVGAEEIRKTQPSHCASFRESTDIRIGARAMRILFPRAIGRYNRARADSQRGRELVVRVVLATQLDQVEA